ncbi:MAG: dihydrofolate reductase family protein [Clostridia bacterium]|nr:dihydrofolate reductase family protein [Clostridia bacterium]
MTDKQRPVTTLFLLISADGKISTGEGDTFDFDADLKNVPGVSEGLHQYYEIEQTTDLWSFNTGRVQAKLGVNQKALPEQSPVSFVLLDNTHLSEHGVRWFCARSKEFVLLTTNPHHPAFSVNEPNLHILLQPTLSLSDALCELKRRFGCERLTIQSGGTVNALFLKEKLIDYVDLVVAPVLVGGKATPTAVDGAGIETLRDLGVLQLIDCAVLSDSYVRLRYRVVG